MALPIRKVHNLSGLTITLFVALHLFNHATSLFGAAIHIELMNSLRIIYRNVFIEIILLSAVIIQILTG